VVLAVEAQNETSARKWWALAAMAMISLVIGLDLMVLNVALPSLAVGLQAATSDLQWFANAYSLVLAAALLPAGLLGDRYGRKKMLLMALGLFGSASLACAYCDSVGQLIAARALLGLGAAFLMPLTMSMLTVLFEPGERARAMTIWITANSVGLPLGPIVGGALLDHFWWGSVFLINLPVVVIALIAAALLLPESRSPIQPRIDLIGVVTSSMGLVALTYGVIRAGDVGWSSPDALIWAIGGVLLLGLFVMWQRTLTRRPGGQPLIDLSLFASKGFLWGTTLATLATFALFGIFFAMPQFFQAVSGDDALETGVKLLPVVGGLLVGARTADKLIKRSGTRMVIAIGFVLFTAGLALGAFTHAHSSYGWIATWFAVVGLGMGFSLPAAMNAAMSALSRERSGVGSALIQAVRQVGGAIGVALLGTVLNSVYRSHVDMTGLPSQAADAVKRGVTAGVAVADKAGSVALRESVQVAFAQALDTMLFVCAAIAALGVVIGLMFLPRRRASTPGRRSGTIDHRRPRVERKEQRARPSRTQSGPDSGRHQGGCAAPDRRAGVRRDHR
jgi:MFS transporter, DHA2 family, multidrug resistance protein